MSLKKVYLIGVGPGDPGLMTARGLEILRQADVVIYDYLVDKRILSEAKEGAELVCCDSLGKKRYSDGFSESQNRINALLIKKAKEAKAVVRLKSGDPSIFSRLSQELEALVKNKIEFEILPGVTAASAASCSTGIPLTDRRFASSCTFVTGHEDPTKKERTISWGDLAKSGTIVLYMAAENLGKIAKELLKAGRAGNTAVAVVQDASLITQKVLTGTLLDIEKAKKAGGPFSRIRPPAIVIIGDVAKLEKKFNWLKKNKRILFTGLSKERFFTRGTYFHLPLIKILPMESYDEFDNYLKDIRRFDWIVFSSRYGVEYFFRRFNAIGCDARALGQVKIAAIGRSTADRLRQIGIIADLVPREESSEGLLKEFAGVDIRDKAIFLPRSDISDKNLSSGFERLGAMVTTSFAYRNAPAEGLPDLDLGQFDEIMFTSPSGVRNFKKRYEHVPKGVKINCIGLVTLKEAKRCRLLN